jgi:nitronate monooxygenase
MTRSAAAAAVRTALREAGGAPIGANAQVARPVPATGDEEAILELLRPFRRELGLPDRPADLPAVGTGPELVEAALEAGAAVVTTFGDPEPVMTSVRAAEVPLLAMVTSADEAARAVVAGARAVIAQGCEAGGHRGAFAVGHTLPDDALPTLLPQVVASVHDADPDCLVIASGGIVDRAGVLAALAAGADGVSCGTVFLQSDEAGVADVYRRSLRDCSAAGTVVTDAVTGRPARWIRNRLVDALITAGLGHAGWPRQGALLADLRRAAADQGRADLLPMLAGRAAAATGSRRPAADIVAELVGTRDTAAPSSALDEQLRK